MGKYREEGNAGDKLCPGIDSKIINDWFDFDDGVFISEVDVELVIYHKGNFHVKSTTNLRRFHNFKFLIRFLHFNYKFFNSPVQLKIIKANARCTLNIPSKLTFSRIEISRRSLSFEMQIVIAKKALWEKNCILASDYTGETSNLRHH